MNLAARCERRRAVWTVVFATVATSWAWMVALVAAQGVPAHDGYDPMPNFEIVASLVERRYWALDEVRPDWGTLRENARSQARAARDSAALDAVLADLVASLGDEHSRYVPASDVDRVREAYGDLPCLGVFGRGTASTAQTDAVEDDSAWIVAGPVRYRLDRELGIVAVDDLARAGTADGVRRAVASLEGAGATSLLLDLRGNPGGRITEMMRVAGAFTTGPLWRIATRWGLPVPYPAIGPVVTTLPLAVAVDGQVASAAEGLAGGLQSSARAVVVGSTTMGNVEAVLPFCLRSGAQVWLATGVLAPTFGPTWEGRGVVPDVRLGENYGDRELLDAVRAVWDDERP